MRTFEEILRKLVFDEYGGQTLEWFIFDYQSNKKLLNKGAKLYAEQALDLAAETVDFKEVNYSEVGDESSIENNMGDIYVIDKDSILSLKDQLK